MTNKQYAEILMELVKGLHGKDLSLALQNFVKYLYNERVLKRAEKIIAEFAKLHKKEEGIEELEVISARELGDKIENEIKKVFGKKIEIETKIDGAILGGLIIKTEDKILDGSLKMQLARLKQSLV